MSVQYFPRAFPRRVFGAAGLGSALASEIARHDLAHIHGLWNIPGWSAARHARRAGVPYVISPRGMLDPGSLAHHAARKRAAYWLLERRHLEGASLLLAASSEEAESFARLAVGVPIEIVPNGVEPPGERPGRGRARRHMGLALDAPLIVFLGRVHPIKRLDLVAAAFARVRERQPRACLVIAGPDESGHRRRIEPLFAPFGDAVRWVGDLGEDEKWALLADADAMALCSDSESFGLSVLEAMAAGVPVVVTRTCPWEEVEREGCGFWVSHDAPSVAAGLLRLLSEPARARAMGDRGRALARAKYSWEPIAQAMAEHYRSVLARRPALAPAT